VVIPTQRTRRRVSRLLAVTAAAAALVTGLAACSSGGGTATAGSKYGFTEAKQVKNSTLTVWVDATRAPVVTAFEKAYPNIKIKMVTYDGAANGSNTFKTKMQLFDRAGSGWPDVVWSTQDNDSAWASQKDVGKQAFAAVLNKGLIPASTLKGFAAGSLAPCTINGTAYCLRNDLAQNVLWYNKTLLDKFGYAVPTTWEQYEALGEKVAKDHPGYIIGAQGDSWAPEIYMWASECQANDVTSATTVTVNTTSTECSRAATMLDTLRKDGTVPNVSVFTPGFLKQYTGKVLMMPGPSWYAGSIFDSKTSLNMPAGQLGAAAPLAWGTSKAVTGDVGGGTWFISSHSQNLSSAAKFLEFATTSDAYQVDLAPGYPAYAPAAAKWISKQESSNYYATSLAPVVTAASQIWTGWGSATFSQEAIWAKTITPAVTSGKDIADLLPTWQTAIKNQAQVDGYTVK
jgi:ABC-type glycerol-3-phosphate transport system substrate-binding protein